jgi:thiamine-phosphate pyrophosphorylase
MFKVIPVTTPHVIPNEIGAICRLCEDGDVQILHVRKPSFSLEEMRQWIASVPSEFRLRLHLHDHFSLAYEFNIGGLHLNGRNPFAPGDFSGVLSASCHSLEEVAVRLQTVDYVFLSPVFDSISKQGYKGSFSFDELSNANINERVIALGGITPENISQIKKWNFGGAAIIGSLWNNFAKTGDTADLIKDYQALCFYHE